MIDTQAFLLLLAVIAVGVLHTMVPDHWAPIVVIARQRGWTRAETVRAAIVAGSGHTVTTLVLGAIVWAAGVEAGARLGHLVDTLASAALIAFGLWIAVGALRELRGGTHSHSHHGHDHHGHDHGHHHHRDHGPSPATGDRLYAPLKTAAVAERHVHMHRHGNGRPHLHWHDHDAETAHAVTADMALQPPSHAHKHRIGVQAAILIILGSSPMVEGLPAFFAASRYSVGFLILMALAFAASTIAAYVVLCTVSLAGLQRVQLGPLERYGEVVSGGFIALVGLAFWVWPVA